MASRYKDERLMTKKHKDILRKNRDNLVECMNPDTIVNKLLSYGVFISEDIESIKQKGTRTSKNECLLDLLSIKADSAFAKLCEVLIEKGQAHLASLLLTAHWFEEPTEFEEDNHKDDRMRSKMPLRIQWSSLPIFIKIEMMWLEHSIKEFNPTRARTKENIEEYFLSTVETMNKEIKEAAKAGHFEKVAHLNKILDDLVETNLKCMDDKQGSNSSAMQNPAVKALDKVWEMYNTGSLQRYFQDALITPDFLKCFGLKQATLTVKIKKEDYESCRYDLMETEIRGE